MSGATIVSLLLRLVVTVQFSWSWTGPLPHLPSRPLASLSTPTPTVPTLFTVHRRGNCQYHDYARRQGSSSMTAARSTSSLSSSSSSSSTTIDTSKTDINNPILAEIIGDRNLSTISFPLLHIGKRIGSGSYGTVHRGYLLRSKDEIVPCIAKRAWTLAELTSDIPMQILKLEQERKQQHRQDNNNKLMMAQRTGLASSSSSSSTSLPNSEKDRTISSESDLKTRAERCEHYWEVERHCFQKMKTTPMILATEDTPHHTTTNGKSVPPIFWGIYRDDGRSGTDGEDSLPGYGALSSPLGKQSSNTNNFWFSASSSSGSSDGGGTAGGDSKGHKWMVFELVGAVNNDGSVGHEPAQTLFDAMEVRITPFLVLFIYWHAPLLT